MINPSANPKLTMIQLANLAYETDPETIIQTVESQYTGLSVVWGPVSYTPPKSYEPVSSAYIVKGPIMGSDANEYTVVIRGTKFNSITSWKNEDFMIGSVVAFSNYVSSAPSGANISQGTANGLDYLNQLNDDGVKAIDFLKTCTIAGLNVAGHSLGGTLVPPAYLILCDQLFQGAPPSNVVGQPFSYAGLTPGNGTFNDFFAQYVPSSTIWRIVNPLDIAPNLWWSQENVEVIYKPWVTVLNWILLHYGEPESGIIDHFFSEASPFGYAQPSFGEYVLPTDFDESILEKTWSAQALHQHHGSTYITLLGG